MNKLIIANWKLHPASEREAIKLVRASDHKNVVICPPFVYIASVKGHVSRAEVGAQNVFWEEEGPHTGEVSAQMLRNIGARYVIVGHSERRAMGETDEMVSAKVATALLAGLKVILCVGEPRAVRSRGIRAARKFVERQLAGSLAAARAYRIKLSNLIIAYEPIWAIGSGKPDNPKETAHIVEEIRKAIDSRFRLHDIRVLYGGSIHAKNAKNFLTVADGALVGGASLRPHEFKKIVHIAQGY